MTDKEKIEEMASIIDGERDVCVRMKQLMDCKYCTCKNENGECGFAEYIARTFFAEGYRKVVDGDLPKDEKACEDCREKVRNAEHKE